MKKPILITLCAIIALLALAFYVFGWGNMLFKPKTSAPAAGAVSYEQKQEAYEYIENDIKENVSLAVLETILKISVYSRDGETMDVSVRVYAADGAYIPQAAAEICPLVVASVQEKGYALEKITIQEYFEDMKKENELTSFINWATKDGAVGILTDDRSGKEIIEFNYSIADLFTYFDVAKP